MYLPISCKVVSLAVIGGVYERVYEITQRHLKQKQVQSILVVVSISLYITWYIAANPLRIQ